MRTKRSGSGSELRMRIRIGLMLLTAGVAAPALADRRSFVRAYEYATQPQGNLELEIWNDVDMPKAPFSAADALMRFSSGWRKL